MSDEKSFSVCQEMLPLFRAVLKTELFTIDAVATATGLDNALLCYVMLGSFMVYGQF